MKQKINNLAKRRLRPASSIGTGVQKRAKLLVRYIGKAAVISYKKRRMRQQLFGRVYASLLILLFLASTVGGMFLPFIPTTPQPYELSAQAKNILPRQHQHLANYLEYNGESDVFAYNENYTPLNAGDQMAGTPRLRSTLGAGQSAEMVVTDPQSETSITMTPRFETLRGRQDVNQIVYPLKNLDGFLVYTTSSVGIKEDIVLNSFDGNEHVFEYDLQVPDGVQPRIETNGSIGFYGVSSLLLGSVSTGSEADEELLTKARQNGQKNNLLFTIPAPVAFGQNRKPQPMFLRYELDGAVLKLVAKGLHGVQYPVSIDPSIYVETARKLMRGNNETNVDFDIDNELFQKAATSGARFDAWQNTIDMDTATWNHAATANNGFVYRAGGRTGPSKPQIADTVETISGNNNLNSFTVDMPAVRPAGDLYIVILARKQKNEPVSIESGSGWTKYADVNQHVAYWKIGTDEGGGNESATYAFNYTDSGKNGQWAAVAMRITNFDSADPISGTPAAVASGKDYPVFPAVTPDEDATLLIRSASLKNRTPSNTGWVPQGHTKISSLNSEGSGGDVALIAASKDTPPLSGVSSGTQQVREDGTTKEEHGVSTIAINPVAVTTENKKAVHWAEFNSNSKQIQSANPGNGTCLDWCSESVYDLPQERRAFSMVAYNGYLYAIGGIDNSASRVSTVYITKLGVNGEPSLWHPTDTNKNNWVYWYSDTGLPSGTARSYLTAVAFNNRMYIAGGQTNASTGGTNTMQYADINPNGTIGSWNSTTVLPSVRHGHTMHIYNDTMYLLGGNSNGTMQNSVHYTKINSDGTLNSWVATSSFVNARTSYGGANSTIISGYIYLSGGCTAVNGSGYCTTQAADIQLASINADGSLAEWNTILGLETNRIGYTLFSWQGALYRVGGCSAQNVTTGECVATVGDVDYGEINPDGDASTVTSTSAEDTGTCVSPNWYNCDLPIAGNGARESGQMNSAIVINNGFIYVIGGCADVGDVDECSGGDRMSDNVVYAALSASGSLVRASTCPEDWVGNWCVDDQKTINDGVGVGTAGATVFNNTVYVVGGTTGKDWLNTIWRTTFNSDGSVNAWSSQTFAGVGMTGTGDDHRGYLYTFARANPASAGTNPGNLYVLGGCRGADEFADGINCSNYYSDVYKCNIATAGTINGCTTTGQLQIDADNVNSGNQGLGLMAGAMYANFIYLVGGACTAVGSAGDPCGSTYASSRKDTIYAKIDNSNNIVDADGETVIDNVWSFTTGEITPSRIRSISFGYNGYLYSLAGYSGSEALQDLLFAKIDVLTGDVTTWTNSGVVVSPRWDLRAIVSNGYVYAIGGCISGIDYPECTDLQPQIQIFQLYNNDSGAVNNYTAQSDQTFSTATDRWGASATIHDGKIFVAGGCVSATDCTDATSDVQYATINANDGTIGTWSSSQSLPSDRTWGSLHSVGDTLYYVGGQTDTATDERSEVFYSVVESPNWYNNDWSYRKSIVVDKDLVSGSLTDFPVLISLATDSDLAADAQNDFDDILFTSDDGLTKLSHEIESFDETTGELVAWVKVPTLADTNNEILYMYYGNGTVGNQEDATNVWDNDFEGVWHLSENPTAGAPQFTDSTGSGNDATAGTSLVAGDQVASKVNGGINFEDASDNDHINAGNVSGVSSATQLTVSAWAYLDDSSTNDPIVEKDCDNSGTNCPFFIQRQSTNDRYRVRVTDGSTGITLAGADNSGSSGSWQYVAMTFVGNNASGLKLYINGSEDTNSPVSTSGINSIKSTTQPVLFGRDVGNSDELDGKLDEIRISTTVRSADWITTEFNNQDDPGAFISLGNESTEGGASSNILTWNTATNVLPAARTKFGADVWNGRIYVVGGLDGSAAVSNTVYVSPDLSSGGDITAAWTSTTAFNYARTGAAVTAYANNLYLFGGFDGTNYMSDSQFTQINSDGTVDSWSYSTSLPSPLRDARAISVNGYIYLVGGRSAATTCPPNTLVSPISANTTIASGNNPTGVGEWYETNVKYSGDRYGAAVAYDNGKLYTMGGGCTAPLSTNRHYYSTVKSQPQVAQYSRLIDTDTDVFPTKWLMNGLDNSIGARWELKYRSMNDTDGVADDCGTADMTTFGQETDFGPITLGQPEDYIPLNGSGTNILCARYFYFRVSIDASRTYGYPDDVSRGPTISDISLFFNSDPSKRLRHGKTFTGGEQQPLNTPF